MDGDAYGPGAEADEWVFYLLYQAVRRRDAAFSRVLAPLGLDLAKWRTLSVVHRLGGCTMNELAEFTTIDRTTLTRISDQLTAAGLVERRGSAADRRRVCLFLTPAGEAMFEQALEALRGHNLQALQGVEEEDLAVLRGVLGKILRNVISTERQAHAVLNFVRPEP